MAKAVKTIHEAREAMLALMPNGFSLSVHFSSHDSKGESSLMRHESFRANVYIESGNFETLAEASGSTAEELVANFKRRVLPELTAARARRTQQPARPAPGTGLVRRSPGPEPTVVRREVDPAVPRITSGARLLGFENG